MIRTVEDGHLKVDYRIAGEEAGGGCFKDAFLDRWNEVLRNGSAEDFIGELEFRAARKRLHADPAIAELAVAAGLFLVTALDLGLAADGFPIRNFRRVQRDVDAVAFLQPADDDLDMLLAAAGEEEFFCLRIAVKSQGLIFFQDLVKRVAHPVLIVPGFRLNRIGNGRLRHFDGRIADGRVFRA